MALHEGYMGKRGGVQGKAKWRRRWFVLQGSSLSYFAKKGDSAPKGSLSLTEAYLISSSAQSRPLCFQVVCPDRTYYFEPENPTDRKKWINVIRSAMPAEGVANKKKILYSGVLMKLGGASVSGKKTKWQRRFCCVQDGELAYYLRPRNMFPPEKRQGTIQLTGAALSESADPHHPFGFDIKQGDRVYTLEIPPRSEKAAANRRGSAVFQYEEDKLNEEEQADVADSFRQWIGAICIAIPTKVFGVPLDLAVQRSKGTDETQQIPGPILMATHWLNRYGLYSEGLYRVSGSKTEVDSLMAQYDSGIAVSSPPDKTEPAVLASLIVQFLKRCPDSIFSNKYAQVFEQITAEYHMQKQTKQLLMMKKLLTMIPVLNQTLLRVLGQHLVLVASHSEANLMTIPKLAACVYTRMTPTLQLCLEHYQFFFEQTARPEKEKEKETLEYELTETIRRVTVSHAPKFDEGDSDEEEKTAAKMTNIKEEDDNSE